MFNKKLMENNDKFIKKTVKFLMAGREDKITMDIGIESINALVEEAYLKGQRNILKREVENIKN